MILDKENINIVLYQPEIPQNTGNIVRTCVLTNSKLHLIRPLGFEVTDKQLRRAGLDYWKDADISYYDSFEELREKFKDRTFYYSTTKATKYYDEVDFKQGDFIVFGRESSGLPDEIRNSEPDNLIRIPMVKTSLRSLNLSNTVSIVSYEATRQIGFPNMK
ncbi:tRNA (cytidine(34)-2'-O)-methyltransferase [Clostridium cellulovorans]|uniref:Putative tRNA (cytidine(34)-2'-O)-methyltransferase n=1 Tax=Clostridium cellulovorans (strain ATCC 35296 / DSM 3052 / OCM 3 / 743B) TaxID=573061 RepID=D9SRW3_CLOC7|nr:tRNA (cytidine(34)-2'-O)-methyltransferase [Clostridium cellulovorans]ADL50480.1 tRNA/rRNA methyltransferase (SpoU) [Clostridium cellulovorans 743B]